MLKFVSKTFATQSTFRMLRGISAGEIRECLLRHAESIIGLADVNTQQEFDGRLLMFIGAFAKENRLKFGHSAKLVDLFVKELALRRDVLSDADARKLHQLAHVPVDSKILKRMWSDFEPLMKEIGIKKNSPIKDVTQDQYQRMQAILRNAAGKISPPLDYDLWWAAD